MSKHIGGKGPEGPKTPEDNETLASNPTLAKLQEDLLDAKKSKDEKIVQSLEERSSRSVSDDLFRSYRSVKFAREIVSFLASQEGSVDGKLLIQNLRSYYKEDKNGEVLYEDADLLSGTGLGKEIEELFRKNEFSETYQSSKILLKTILREINKAIDQESETLSNSEKAKDPGFLLNILNNSTKDWRSAFQKLPKKMSDKLLTYINNLFGTGGAFAKYLITEFKNKNKQAIDTKSLKSLMADQLFSKTEDVILNSLLNWKDNPNTQVMVNPSEFSKITRENDLSSSDIEPKEIIDNALLPLFENSYFEKHKVELAQLCKVLKDRYQSVLSDKKEDQEYKDYFLSVLSFEAGDNTKKYNGQLFYVKGVLNAYIEGAFDQDVKNWITGKEVKQAPSLLAQHKVLGAAKQLLDMNDQFFANRLLDDLNYYAEQYEENEMLAGKDDFYEFQKLWTDLKAKKLLDSKNLKSSLATRLGLKDQSKIAELIDEKNWSALSSFFKRKYQVAAPRARVEKTNKPAPASAPVPAAPTEFVPEIKEQLLNPEAEGNATKLKELIKQMVDEDVPGISKAFEKFDFKNKQEFWEELVTRINPKDYPTMIKMLEVLQSVGERFEKLMELGFSSKQMMSLDEAFFKNSLFDTLFVLDAKDKITIGFDSVSLDAWEKLNTRYVSKFLKLLEDPLFPELRENLGLPIEELLKEDGRIDEVKLNSYLAELKKLKKVKGDFEDKK